MLIDSIVIKIIKKGGNTGPDYSLTIYGYGKVIYKGNKNVKLTGTTEESIEESKVESILQYFEGASFFSLNDDYSTQTIKDQPSTVISISITDEDGKKFYKSVTYPNNSKDIPNELKDLEFNINRIVKSQRWIGKPSEIAFIGKTGSNGKSIIDKLVKEEADRPVKKRPIPRKYIAAIILIIILVALSFALFFLLQTDFFISNPNNVNTKRLTPTVKIQANKVSGDPPLNIYFTSLTENFTGKELSYNWDFGDGYASTEKNPGYTYENIGLYVVTLNVTDDKNNSATDNITISTEPLILLISADKTFGSPPLNVSFKINKVDGGIPPYSFNWDFDDGNFSTEENPRHVFTEAGNFLVQLNVTDSAGVKVYDNLIIRCY